MVDNILDAVDQFQLTLFKIIILYLIEQRLEREIHMNSEYVSYEITIWGFNILYLYIIPLSVAAVQIAYCNDDSMN